MIGIGASGKATLSERSLGIIKRAGLVAGGARHLKEFPESSGRRVPVKGGLEKTARAIEGYIAGRKARGKRSVVAVLATGDPSLFGIAGFMVRKFSKRSVEIIPNVSIVQEALPGSRRTGAV